MIDNPKVSSKPYGSRVSAGGWGRVEPLRRDPWLSEPPPGKLGLVESFTGAGWKPGTKTEAPAVNIPSVYCLLYIPYFTYPHTISNSISYVALRATQLTSFPLINSLNTHTICEV